jgi:predicted nucleic acid-binding protein
LTTLIGTAPFEACDDYDSASLAILRSSRLGPGESEGIAQAAQRNVPIFLTDDRRARSRARGHGLRVVGTARLIARLARLGLVADYWIAIEELRALGHRIGTRVAREAMDRERTEDGF